MESPKTSSDLFWKIIVVVLLLIVAVQLYLMRQTTSGVTSGSQITGAVPAVCPAATVNSVPQLRPPIPPPVSRQQQIIPPRAPVQQTQPVVPSTSQHGINPYDQPQIRSGAEMFEEMQKIAEQMMREMDNDMPMHLFGSVPTGDRPLAYGGPTLKATPENYIVKLEMPGLDKANINATIKNEVLTITGKQETTSSTTKAGNSSHISSSSHFQTSLHLPGPVKSDHMNIDYQGNVLTITVPRK